MASALDSGLLSPYVLGSLVTRAHQQPCKVNPARQVWQKSWVQVAEEAGERMSQMSAETIFIKRGINIAVQSYS